MCDKCIVEKLNNGTKCIYTKECSGGALCAEEDCLNHHGIIIKEKNMTHKIYIRKYNNKGKDYFDISADWPNLSLGTITLDRDKGIEAVKNSLAALETYGEKIISERNSGYNPRTPILNWFKKLFKIGIHNMTYRALDPGKIPKSFDRELAKSKIIFEISEEPIK